MTQPSWNRETVTLEEILAQPQRWMKCLQLLTQNGLVRQICTHVPEDAVWLFVGCGTSYYLALSAAATFTAVTGMPARAVTASDLLLFPNVVLNRRRTVIPVLISRSGKTTETVHAAEFLELERGIRTVAMTCTEGSALSGAVRFALILTPAAERSTVMTSSFTSMLLGLQFLAGTFANDPAYLRGLSSAAAAVAPLVTPVADRLRDFVARYDFEDYVFLGQGPYYGIACEAALKVMESSCSYAQSFHTLEFRHGPKSIVSPKTLIGFFVSESGKKQEVALLEEIKALGATTFVVTAEADSRTRAAADFLVEVPAGLPEFCRPITYMPWAQMLGVFTGLKKGLDPDSPRNLSQVVILSGTR